MMSCFALERKLSSRPVSLQRGFNTGSEEHLVLRTRKLGKGQCLSSSLVSPRGQPSPTQGHSSRWQSSRLGGETKLTLGSAKHTLVGAGAQVYIEILQHSEAEVRGTCDCGYALGRVQYDA